jgi:hypothetical protein
MTVENVERKLWTCNACGTDEITTGDMPKDWSTKWAWATRYVIPERKDRPKIFDIAIHTCHECSSGPMHFIVRRLIEHLTDDKAREFKGERCKRHPECTLPDKHEGGHRVPPGPSKFLAKDVCVDPRDAPGNHVEPCPPLHGPPLHGPPLACPVADCVMPAHGDAIHMNGDGDEFEQPEVDKDHE